MYKVFFLFLTLSLIACGNAKQQELDALEDEVMRIHDESMLGMSDLKAVQKALAQIDASTLEEGLQKELKGTRQNLALADSLMWDWMHNYSAPDKSKVTAAETYLQEELKKITRVDELMNNSIEAGDQLHAQLKSGKNE